jgi:hypothetical protein
MTAMENILQFTNKNTEANYCLLDVKIQFAHWLQSHGMAKNTLAITHHHRLASTKPCQPWSLAKTVNISNILT